MSGPEDYHRSTEAETRAYIHTSPADDLTIIGDELAKDPIVLWRIFALCPILTSAAAHFDKAYIEVERTFERLDLARIAPMLDTPEGCERLVYAIGNLGGWSSRDPFIVTEH